MEYEVICEIKNSCSGNQMRDVFFEELEIDDPDAWIRKREVNAASIEREDFPGGIRYHVMREDIPTVYTLTEI
ncbi:MAG: hypothetical protein IJU67_05285 [Lachnospiraceae bacterium]|nr:hypothetical protein [Lachnospiraceae bacterium]MBQ3400488.1 hypothetical protein [Lachnospiraceae bacterium]MBQ4309407.1 hypothetical protein [Lachnospiraceae bacterium]MBQ9464675.1 hypothetical protein [Lachnospiraceae bacterium]MBR0105781.1 hypothetical protein [Lachnospiraceae bacterium]